MPRWTAFLWIASMGAPVTSGIISGLLPSNLNASGIPYATGDSFASNPMGSEVSLPPLPDALRPMGPPKAVPPPRTEPVIATLPPAEIPKPEQETASNTEGAPAAPAPDQTLVAASPFLDWIQKNKDAAELARAAREHYKAGAGTGTGDGSSGGDSDLLLNVRYPYLWNQEQPPGGGAVIYSVPKR